MPATKKAAELPKATFSSVAIVVSDRKRSRAWYTRTLGLDLIMEMDHWVTVGRKGKAGVLHLCQTSDFDESIPLEKGPTGIQLYVPGDFRAACAALEANGVKFRHPPTEHDWGWGADIEDPDGNEISLHPAE
ncbi:MAG: VOC family protein [Thermoplasmata archaeon]